MKKLAVIGDPQKYKEGIWRERRAARAVIRDKDGRIALMYVSKHGYYKLPGGGIDDGESVLDALHREISEEVGAEIHMITELGFTEEFAPTNDVHQYSYCFVADLKRIAGEPQLTDGEKEHGMQVYWAENMKDAIIKIENPEQYPHPGVAFVSERDSALLKAVVQ